MADPKERWRGQSAYKGAETCKIAYEEFCKGATVLRVCVLLGICDSTIYKWRDTYPEFADAFNMGRAASKAWGLDMLWDIGQSDKKVNQSVLIFSAKHRWDLHDEIKLDTSDDKRQVLLDELAKKAKTIVDRD